MQRGGDIHSVYERLCRAVSQIEAIANFSHDDHLGFIASCPTNIGTALRGSTHLKLPRLGRNMAKF